MDKTPHTPSRDQWAQLRHELKTPLNHILGYSEMLEEMAVEAEQNEFVPDLRRIQQAARNLAAQIDRFFSPASESTGVPPLARFHHDEDAADEGRMPVATRPAVRGRLLVVDDNELNRDLLARRLTRQGHSVTLARNGRECLETIRKEGFDLVLLDIMMPEMDGFTVLEQIKSDVGLRDIPVIMISSLDELQSVARCISIGAEDYLPKPFNPTILRARIGACLEKKHLRDQERQTFLALQESQRRLAAELAEAASYVRSILPPALSHGEVLTEWCFRPSMQLGGDGLGYHWLSENHLAMFILDVSGHGVGAALLSISAMNVLRSQTLPVDFCDPAAVLAGMNHAFQMEQQNNMFFSLWYGVYDRRARVLSFANAGHPPPVLFAGGPSAKFELGAPGRVIGSFPDLEYCASSVEVLPGSRLYLYSDGAYEIPLAAGGLWTLEAFLSELQAAQVSAESRIERVLAKIDEIRAGEELLDDLSILEMHLQ
jgi:sigma-B regulation protein RsbU (phosphoserine phosphatase)